LGFVCIFYGLLYECTKIILRHVGFYIIRFFHTQGQATQINPVYGYRTLFGFTGNHLTCAIAQFQAIKIIDLSENEWFCFFFSIAGTQVVRTLDLFRVFLFAKLYLEEPYIVEIVAFPVFTLYITFICKNRPPVCIEPKAKTQLFADRLGSFFANGYWPVICFANALCIGNITTCIS